MSGLIDEGAGNCRSNEARQAAHRVLNAVGSSTMLIMHAKCIGKLNEEDSVRLKRGLTVFLGLVR